MRNQQNSYLRCRESALHWFTHRVTDGAQSQCLRAWMRACVNACMRVRASDERENRAPTPVPAYLALPRQLHVNSQDKVIQSVLRRNGRDDESVNATIVVDRVSASDRRQLFSLNHRVVLNNSRFWLSRRLADYWRAATKRPRNRLQMKRLIARAWIRDKLLLLHSRHFCDAKTGWSSSETIIYNERRDSTNSMIYTPNIFSGIIASWKRLTTAASVAKATENIAIPPILLLYYVCIIHVLVAFVRPSSLRCFAVAMGLYGEIAMFSFEHEKCSNAPLQLESCSLRTFWCYSNRLTRF